MMEWLFIALGVMVVLGIVTFISEASEKSKMEALLNPSAGQTGFSEERTNQSNFIHSKFDEISGKIEAHEAQMRKLIPELESGRIGLDVFREESQRIQDEIEVLLAEMSTHRDNYVRSMQAPLATQEVTLKMESDNFVATKKFISGANSCGIALDSAAKKIAILTPYSKEILSATQIVSVEICVGSETIISTDRASQIGGAVIGGVLTGGIGALVLAMGAQKKQKNNIKSLQLKLLVTGASKPAYHVDFFVKNPYDEKNAMNDVTDWHDTIAVLMKETAANSGGKILSKNASSSHSSVADEIRKLNDLHNEGLITKEEFNRAKVSLI